MWLLTALIGLALITFLAGAHNSVYDRLATPKFNTVYLLAGTLTLLPVASLRLFQVPSTIIPLGGAGLLLLAGARWINANRQLGGAYLMWAGALCNWLVVTLNQGMPVITDIPPSKMMYHTIDEHTVLPFLADIHQLNIGGEIFYTSIGDMLFFAGNTALLFQFLFLIYTDRKIKNAS